MIRLIAAVGLLGAAFSLLATVPCLAVPEAGHILIECNVLRLNINNASTRHQVKVLVTVSSADEENQLALQRSMLSITRPDGMSATIGNYSRSSSPKQFKAAITRLLFKVVEDSAAPDKSNVEPGFFNSLGPYLLSLAIANETYTGEISFGEPLTLEVRQEGKPAVDFLLRDEAGLDLYTAPATFGPVYYRQQDMSNFVFQLANMDNSLKTGDYHAPVESPRYLFQVRISDGQGGPARLVDPARYIEGYQAHMIRSAQTSTPLHFSADEFSSGEAVVIDFQRESTLPPDTVFSGPSADLSSSVVVTDRVMYVLVVEPVPSSEELGISGNSQ